MANQPTNTFFNINSQTVGQSKPQWAYDWLMHANRPLVSPVELLQVSGYKPHQLTQMFMTQGATPQNLLPQGRFQHRAPWLQANAMIYRALEFLEGGHPPAVVAAGRPYPGQDQHQHHLGPGHLGSPVRSAGDQFFLRPGRAGPLCRDDEFADPGAGSAGAQRRSVFQPGGPLRPARARNIPRFGAAASITRCCGPTPRLRQTTRKNCCSNRAWPPESCAQAANPSSANYKPIGHPALRMELLNKIFGSVTTRSNVFAVWLTVGFFEVRMPNGQLGQEINKAEGCNVRHRMFAILDRTNLTISPNNPGQPGPRPFFINSLTAVTQPGATTITVPTLSGNYEESTWSIQQGMQSGGRCRAEPGNRDGDGGEPGPVQLHRHLCQNPPARLRDRQRRPGQPWAATVFRYAQSGVFRSRALFQHHSMNALARGNV